MNQHETFERHDGIDQRLEEGALFARLDLDPALYAAARQEAHLNGTSLESVLIAGGFVEENRLYREMADLLGLRYEDALAPERISDTPELDVMLREPHSITLSDDRAPSTVATIPPLHRMAHLRKRLRESPALAKRLVITTPSAMRSAIWRAGERRRLRQSIEQLSGPMPHFSSRTTVTGRQGFWIGVFLTLLMTGLVFQPALCGNLIHLVLSLLYLGTLLFRFAAHVPPRAAEKLELPDYEDEPLPTYTVLVALYREADVVPQLLKALSRLDWPPSRLDVKFVCEADDLETLGALRQRPLPPFMEIVLVPDAAPKTKPKALVYALAGTRGEFVTIYDAEDRPHPRQLRAAYRRFRSAGPDLACLQAPLVISNPEESWLSGLFAAEYAIHFQHFLPLLATQGLPMPLGGTSNHFRRDALERSGGWDPFNVAEDADLGLRLHRLGYRVGTIPLPTLEEAPVSSKVWIGQRTRWFKGWMQTFLVSMRDPAELARELGFGGLAAYLLTTVGMLVSALCHPLLFVSLVWTAWLMAMSPAAGSRASDTVFMMLDLVNLTAGYGYFAVAGLVMMRPRSRHFRWSRVLCIPAYWMLLSLASWRALIQLYRRPHFWEKTPHRAVRPRPVRDAPVTDG